MRLIFCSFFRFVMGFCKVFVRSFDGGNCKIIKVKLGQSFFNRFTLLQLDLFCWVKKEHRNYFRDLQSEHLPPVVLAVGLI